MMMHKIAMVVTTLFIAASFSGCATQETKPPTVFVPVVVAKPVLPARPTLSIAQLTPDSEPAAVIKAYAESVLQCTGYATQLEDIRRK